MEKSLNGFGQDRSLIDLADETKFLGIGNLVQILWLLRYEGVVWI